MTIVVGSKAAGRHGFGAISKRLHLIHSTSEGEQERKRTTRRLVWAFETSKPTLSDTPSTRPHLLVQVVSPTRAILIQTTTVSLILLSEEV